MFKTFAMFIILLVNLVADFCLLIIYLHCKDEDYTGYAENSVPKSSFMCMFHDVNPIFQEITATCANAQH
jgi:hypothetical protein